MNSQKFIGIDVSKDSFTVAIFFPMENSLSSQTLSLDHQGLRKLTALIHPPSRLALESSGPYSSLLLGILQSQGFEPELINPLRIKRFSSSLSLRLTKTDPIDAKTIALFLASQPNPSPHLQPDPQRQGLALLARQVEALARQSAALKCQIRQLLHFLFPELPEKLHPFSQSVLHLLLHFPSAERVRKASHQALAESLRKATAGRGRRARLSVARFQDLARNSIGLSDPARESILQSLIRRLLSLEEEKRALARELIRRTKEYAPKAWEVLRSIPGVGELSAALIIAEVGDVSRFSQAKKLIAYAGLDPSVYVSGKTHRRSRISKRGSPHLRRILFIIAQQVVRRTRTFNTFYQRLRRRGKSYRQAMVAVAAKLLRVIYALLTKNVPFQDNYTPNS